MRRETLAIAHRDYVDAIRRRTVGGSAPGLVAQRTSQLPLRLCSRCRRAGSAT